MSEEQRDITPGQDVALFQEKTIRRTWHDKQWWFAIVDVVAVLTDSVQPEGYVKDLRRRDKELAKGWGQIATPLRLQTEGGIQLANCANTEGLLRIIQSIPSPKAEPFKRWLAKVGFERIQEIENPELASARARALYEAKGYPKPWIEKRLRSIAIRGELTDEWKQRGVQEGREYAILTSEIARATFGVTPEGHKKIKGLAELKTGDNLRDHMTDLELIFTMLGEASTTEIARRKDAQGFPANRRTAKEGGTIAGDARKALEAKSGKPVVSASNNLALQAPVEILAAPKGKPSKGEKA
ncbi:MAG: Bro-N domain-containing protein [Gallionella sp.]|nr:Bro-N domain-containing protein [Gallionella sp.]